MSINVFNKIWEQSKAIHRADAESRVDDFQKIEKKCFFLSFRRQFIIERKTVQSEIKKIVAEYVPQIRTWLVQWEDGFNQWEHENSGPSLCGSRSAIQREKEGRDNAERLSSEMIEKISAIPKYNRHFYPIENLADMVENPYPGYLTSERAQNYCNHLLQIF